MENRELLICKCSSDEHQIIFHWWDDDDDGEVYMSTLLNPEWRWYRRIWEAIKYIFGHRSKYGMFDEIILDKNDIPKLEKIIEYLKQTK